MSTQPEPAVPIKISSLNCNHTGGKFRLAGRFVSFDVETQIILVQDEKANGVLVDVSLCVDPLVDGRVWRDTKSVIQVLGYLEALETELSVPLLPNYLEAPSVNPGMVLKAVLIIPCSDLDLSAWADGIEQREGHV